MIAARWREAFFRTVQNNENASLFRQAAQAEDLAGWTAYLTDAVVGTCQALGWRAAAKGHHLDLLPIPHAEYLTLDVMAFAGSARGGWRFPVAAMELENSRDSERIAYSLWKVLCVRAELRIVFCYRSLSRQAPALVNCLSRDVIGALPLEQRLALEGETLVVVGSRSDSSAFPYGFFKWWRLERNTGSFNVLSYIPE